MWPCSVSRLIKVFSWAFLVSSFLPNDTFSVLYRLIVFSGIAPHPQFFPLDIPPGFSHHLTLPFPFPLPLSQKSHYFFSDTSLRFTSTLSVFARIIKFSALHRPFGIFSYPQCFPTLPHGVGSLTADRVSDFFSQITSGSPAPSPSRFSPKSLLPPYGFFVRIGQRGIANSP